MIYLDNNATTPLAPGVAETMAEALRSFGNPSSAHAAGAGAKPIVENARESVAAFLGAREPAEIVFTSGGTESDNWAILGALEADRGKRRIVTTRVEHEAVRKLCEKLEREGSDVVWLDVDEFGRLDLDRLHDSHTPDTAIVSVMMANNETGVVFPVAEIARIVKEHSDALVHVDGVNAAGKIPIDLKSTEVDLFSISAHKFHGPKGIGALYIRDGVHLPPFLIGGGQESGRRAGTEAVHQIAGIGAAAGYAADLSPMETVRELRDRLETEILKSVPGTYINGDRESRLPNTSNVSFDGLNGEIILHELDRAGICVSTGSACHSGSHASSPVLQAMNLPYSRAMGSIRFSLGRSNTANEIDEVIGVVKRVAMELRKLV
jgi:cysteine desulfurase